MASNSHKSTSTPGLLVMKSKYQLNQTVDKHNYQYDASDIHSSQENSLTKLSKNCSPTKYLKFNKYSYTRPTWYNTNADKYKEHTLNVIDNLEKADTELQFLIESSSFLTKWETFMNCRSKIQNILELMLIKEIKFCREVNVEQHIWKIAFYNVIELLKNHESNAPIEIDNFFKSKCLEIIDDGLVFYSNLLNNLEKTYKFSLNDYLGPNSGSSIKGLKFISLALVSVQKILLFLGDLSRYREQIESTRNFSNAKKWYVKAHELIPTNGLPYNQLAVVSLCTKRKFDAVYYYMRSLMSSNPIHSAKESLKVLFDETRKKFENNLKLKAVAETKKDVANRMEHRLGNGPLRRETWIHPEGGRTIHRTAPLQLDNDNYSSSDDEDLHQIDSLELNKRFSTSYIHVHGKLITKIGMDTFIPCANQMLKELQMLLGHSPIILSSQRLLQLMALNMFSIDSTRLRETSLSPGSRSEIQEYAMSMSFCMFGIMLERFLELIQKSKSEKHCKSSAAPLVTIDGEAIVNSKIKPNKFEKPSDGCLNCYESALDGLVLSDDAKTLLPAIKIWCDWLRCNENIWNPSPNFSQYKLHKNRSPDPWTGLAMLVSILENCDINKTKFVNHPYLDSTELIRLPEDIYLLGFAPISTITTAKLYANKLDENLDAIQTIVRLQHIYSFGLEYLCNCIPTVLKKVLNNGKIEYISIVPNNLIESRDADLLVESFSEDDDDNDVVPDKLEVQIIQSDETLDENSTEVRKLLLRKDELERRHRMQEQKNRRLQEILRQSIVSLIIEVRPKYLVPDTNCFIDFLEQLKTIAKAHPLYQLIIPIVVINELEGLSRGGKMDNQPKITSPLEQTLKISTASQNASLKKERHFLMVTEAAKSALTFLKTRHPAVKCVTTKGSIMGSLVFTAEDDNLDKISNDDKILLSASNISSKSHVDKKMGERQFLIREVVLLTTDRNLRVKALSQNIPVRELPDFIKWSGLSS